MNEKKLNLQQNIIWNTIGMSVYLGCQWLITVLVVRLSSDFTNSGLLTLAMSVTNIFYAIASYSMRAYQVSDVEGKYSDSAYMQIRTFTCGAAFILCMGYSLILYHDMRFSGIMLYMVFRIIEAFVDVLQGFDQKAMRMDIIGKSMIARGVLNVAAFSLVIYITDSFNLAVIAMIVVSAVVMIIYDVPWASRFAKLRGKLEPAKVKGFLIECLPMGVASALGTSIISIPRSLLDHFHGQEILGIYGALAVPTVIVQVAATYIFNPMLSLYALHYTQKDKKAFYKLFNRTMIGIGALSVLALVAAALLEDILLPVLLGESIRPYTSLFMPMLIFTILNAVIWFQTTLLVVIREFRSYLVGTVGAVVISMVLGWPLIKKWSMSGVNATLILVAVIQLIFFGIVLLRKFRENFKDCIK